MCLMMVFRLICALSLIADKPRLLKKLFAIEEYSPEGVYAMLVNWRGIWTEVFIDDLIPCSGDSQLAFCRVSQQGAIATKFEAQKCFVDQSLLVLWLRVEVPATQPQKV